MRPVVEVCLVSHDSGSEILAAIDSVLSHLPDAALAIQENSASTATLELVAKHEALAGHQVRTVHDPSNPGFGAACNALAADSDAEWLLFLNPDATIDAWPFSEQPPPAGQICGPATVNAARPGSHRGIAFSVTDEARRSWLRRWGTSPRGTGFVSGAALLISLRDFVAINGFDERFFLFYEDIDLCLRANAAGIETHVVDGFAITHAGAHSTSDHFGASLVWSYESGCLFHDIHGHSVAWFRSAYVAADSIARWCLHTLRCDRQRRQGYATLFGRSAHDLLTRSAP